MLRAVLLAASLLMLAGCGTTGTASPAQSTPKTTGSSDCAPPGGTAPRMSPALQNRETSYLTGVSATTNGDCSESVVFAFEKGAPPGPGYEVKYEPAASAKIEDGSGNPIAVDGSAFLVVRLNPAATAKTVGDKLQLTYTGPRRLRPTTRRHVQEVVKTGDFEAVVTWVIGLDSKRPFVATASETQLVVEIS